MNLAQHLALIKDENRASGAAPLSARKAWLVVVLLDNFADRVFEAFRELAPQKVFHAADLPAYRAALRAHAPLLGAIFDLGALRADGPELAVTSVEIPIAEYHKLPVEDYMVSLYNGNTVQRVVIRFPDGSQRLARDVLD
ncbi:MAG TPA: hypothetical protein VL418_07000, partial [Devosiaceae bacterium]|nr:hypothetical protein [Devosiaceae bacterium]